MVERPSPDLRGGCAAMRIPTATEGRGSVTTTPTRPPVSSRFNGLSRRSARNLRAEQQSRDAITRGRCHSAIGNLSPVNYERSQLPPPFVSWEGYGRLWRQCLSWLTHAL